MPSESFVPDGAFVVAAREHKTIKDIATSLKFIKAGPRKAIFFDPTTVKAAIVTCGGVAPGLNVIIRALTMSLRNNYGVREIYGIRVGYKGFYTDTDKNWIRLEPQDITDLHKQGGTMLLSSRGGFDGEKILNSLVEKGISQVYIVGGDGTHRGIFHLTELAQKRGVNIAFAGLPKTIDNDISLIDQSFGFDTSCEVAAKLI